MQKLIYHPHFWLSLGLLVVDSVFFTLTDPSNVASVLLMLGFILLALTTYVIISRILAFSGLYGFPGGRHRHRLAVFGTTVLGGLVALQSIGQLSSRDILMIAPLAVLLYLYLAYGRKKQAL